MSFQRSTMNEMEYVTVAKIVKPFGVRGQVRVLSLTDVPGRLENLQDVMLETAAGRTLFTNVTDVTCDGKGYRLRFAAFSSPEEVGEYRRAWVKIPQDEVPPAPEGHVYQFELIGLTVKEESGVVLGIVEEVVETPAYHLLVIRGERGELLLPASKKWITHVDIPNHELIVVSKSQWSSDDAV